MAFLNLDGHLKPMGMGAAAPLTFAKIIISFFIRRVSTLTKNNVLSKC
jgi:hypothetical protein